MKRNQGSEGELADGPAQKKTKMSPTLSPSSNATVPKQNRNDNANIMPSASSTAVPMPGMTTVEGNATTTEPGTWTKVEKRKKKKMAKAEAKNDPRFMYSNHEIARRNNAIGVEEIRDLVLHLVADAPNPNWLRVENGTSIQKVVVLMVPGLTNQLLSLPPIPTSATSNPNLPLSIPLHSPATTGTAAAIPFVATTFSHACPTRAPGDQYRMHSVLSTFFSCPISSEEKRRRVNQRLKSDKSKADPTQYLLTLEQMIENDYPVPSYMADVFQKPEGWVETPQPQNEPPAGTSGVKRKIYAIDCEMCITEDGKELTRISIIDFHTNGVVYDQLVKPSKPIVDYLTRFSGITEQHLASVTTTLAEVQTKVLSLLCPTAPVLAPNPFSMNSNNSSPSSPPPPPPTPILMGHSLESDLRALKLCHPYCIDTALMYHHPRGRPLKPGLAWLTKKWCGREIQTRGEGGHDPEEDARACLDLLKKKLEEGPGFGEFKTDQESIFERFGRASRKRGSGPGGGVRSAVVDYGNPVQMHGNKATTALACKTDEEIVEGVLGVVPSHDFVFARLTGLADRLGWITPRGPQDTPISTSPAAALQPPTSPTDDQLQSTLASLNTHLSKIHGSLPPRTAFVLFTGHSDPRRMTQLNSRKAQFDNALRAGKSPEEIASGENGVRWTAADGRELEEAVELARRGLVFVGVKM
ncbi:hypothetical protein MD484_g489, partial [Candolleomyces efflorescens]